MTQAFRTGAGGLVDRSRPLRFTFDGQEYRGLEGDTLASALLANGVHLAGRSFKYHRPRGILGAGAEEPNALVNVARDAARSTPNLSATQVELHEGLVATSQNRWPSLKLDVGALNGLIGRFIPAGFYYKTFKWPRRAWHALYEPRIRAAAGLGLSPTLPDPDRYAQRYAHCEVLVVGLGPAGLAAALAAARSGVRVIACEQQPVAGGSLLAEPAGSPLRIDALKPGDWLAHALAELRASPNVTLLTRTQAFAVLPHNSVALAQRLGDHLASPPPGLPRERLWQVRAAQVVHATGAIERPLVFGDNDRPGIMLAGAARMYLNRFGVLPGSRIAVLAAHDSAWRAALDLKAAGAHIAVLADLRADAPPALAAEARAAGIEVRTGVAVAGTRGRSRVTALGLATHGPTEWIDCDALLMSGGWTPAVHLHSQGRGALRWDEGSANFLPGDPGDRSRSAGACAGYPGARLGSVLAEGARTAAVALAALGHQGAVAAAPQATGDESLGGGWLGLAPATADARGKCFVDWQNDVTAPDLALAVREGMRSIEHVKRYTTTGMATDQGKTSNLNALAIAAQELDAPLPAVGLTTFRAPYTPVTFGSFAGYARGELFDPVRRTPMGGWAAAQGAVFEPVGLWQRARYFPRAGEDMHAAVARECVAVRGGVGLFDASTLGKIEVVGPDAAEFLNRLYVNSWDKLAVGRCRYGILLRDDGFVYDDGVVARTAPDRFHVTTTTGGAPRVLAMMEDYLQTEWQELKVWLTSTTEQWAVIAVQGPRARDVIAPLVEGIDLATERFPHMACARGRVAGVPALLFRVSFTGELGYEINVPADFGLEVWKAVWQAGQAHGICPYGTETMHVLRAEKGYIIVGQDTDGTVTADDAGLSWAVGKNKPDYLGLRSLAKPALAAANRKQFVGLATVDPKFVLEEGSQVTATPGLKPPHAVIGHVTSSYYSAVLGRSIALAMVERGRSLAGQTLYVPGPAGEQAVLVTSPVFYDPKGERLHG